MQAVFALARQRIRAATPCLAGRVLLVGASLALTACATSKPPTDQLAVATAAVAHAAAAGSTELAPNEMRMARDKLARANTAMTAKDYDVAVAMAQQSTVDAELAQARAEAFKSQKAANEVQEAARVLREEMSRKAK